MSFEFPLRSSLQKVKEILGDASVKKITIKDQSGKVLLTIPVTWGAAGS